METEGLTPASSREAYQMQEEATPGVTLKTDFRIAHPHALQDKHMMTPENCTSSWTLYFSIGASLPFLHTLYKQQIVASGQLELQKLLC